MSKPGCAHLVSEGLHGLPLGRLELLLERGLRRRDPHSLAAPAANGLDHHGEADLGRLLLQPLKGLVVAVVPSAEEEIAESDAARAGNSWKTFTTDMIHLHIF